MISIKSELNNTLDIMDVLDFFIEHLSNLGLRRLADILVYFRNSFSSPSVSPNFDEPMSIIVDVHDEEDWEPIKMIRKSYEIPRPNSAAAYIMV